MVVIARECRKDRKDEGKGWEDGGRDGKTGDNG
jgi:hypothetical protein